MSKVLYIGWFDLPESAAGIRVYQIAKVLREGGNEVVFLCLSQSTIKKDDNIEYDGFSYIRKAQSSMKIKSVANIIFGYVDFDVIKETINSVKPDSVIIYNEKERLTRKLVHYCHQQGITVGADVTEWYELSRSKKWNYIVSKNVDFRIRKMDVELDYIISISPYLTAYYKSIGCKQVVEIPPIMDCIKSTIIPTEARVRHFVYAGSPAQKDLLLPFLKAVEAINKEQIRIFADVVGVSEEQINGLMQTNDSKKNGIIAFGRVPHQKCIRIVEMADFSILFRENLRYAKAGFSTKLSESLSLGIPVLCNAVGGADVIIQDGINGIKINSYEVEEIIKAIERILDMDQQTIDKMKKNALNAAQRLFLGSQYIDMLNNIVNQKLKNYKSNI